MVEILDDLVNTLLPLSICCLLPLGIFWLYYRAQMNKENKRTEIIMKALESNSNIDTDSLVKALENTSQTPQGIRYARLQRGCQYTLLGIALCVVFFISNGMEIDSDMAFLMIFAGAASIAVGISYLIVYLVSGKSSTDNNSSEK
ncbi:MAG: DUF6249 domain-containing protein [Bacteroidales bacterium]|nr:DUF6249 domain-containing protein [Bacteroidales bacterium]